jgi:hypothetical protein
MSSRRIATFEQLESRTLMSAVPLAPGATAALTGTTAAAQPELAGVVIRDALIPFSVNDAVGHTIFKGKLQDRVVRENVAGTLDFYQTIRADPGFATPAILEYVTRANFGGFITAPEFRTDGIGNPAIAPEQAARSGDGKALRYNFHFDTVNPGDTSLFYFAKTNSTKFDVKGVTAIAFGQGPISGSGNGSVKVTTAEPVRTGDTKPGNISGLKFYDLNGNGKRDKGEPGLRGWTIYLDNNHNGHLDAGEPSRVTDGSGNYSFLNVPTGPHQVREVMKPGWHQTAPGTGVYNVLLPPGGNVSGVDFGNTRLLVTGGLTTTGLDGGVLKL